jgi:hypothetical protein
MLLSGRGLYRMAMVIHYLEKYFQNIVEIKAARLRNQSTMGCEFYCTRNIKLPGKSVVSKLQINSEELSKDNFGDIGKLNLNRKKQKEGTQELSINDNIKLKTIFTGAAISMQDAARSSLAKSDKRSNVI